MIAMMQSRSKQHSAPEASRARFSSPERRRNSMSIALARPGQSITESFLYNSPYPHTPQTGRSGTARLRAASPSAAEILSSLPVNPARSVRSAEKGLLRKEGEYWTVGYDGRVFRLKDTKGLAYLAQLLRHPGTQFHALDLVGGTVDRSEARADEANRAAAALPKSREELQSAGLHVGGLGDAGAVLDEPAKAAYRRRLAELRAAVAEAKQLDQCE